MLATAKQVHQHNLTNRIKKSNRVPLEHGSGRVDQKYDYRHVVSIRARCL